LPRAGTAPDTPASHTALAPYKPGADAVDRLGRRHRIGSRRYRHSHSFYLSAAVAIACRVFVLWVCIIAAGLFVIGWAMQILGHQVFERRRPMRLDNAVQMLISPMYIVARLFIALSFRPDLAAVLRKSSKRTPLGPPPCPVEGGADVDQTA